MNATASATATGRGLRLEGQFLGTEQQRDTERNGQTFKGKFVVKLLTPGDRVFAVEYKDEQTAKEMVPDLGLVQRLDVIELPVGVRAAKGYTFWFGRHATE